MCNAVLQMPVAAQAGALPALFAFVETLCAHFLLGGAILDALRTVLLCWQESEVVDSCWLHSAGPNGENRSTVRMLEALAGSLGLAGEDVRFQDCVEEVDEHTFRSW